MKEKGIRKKFLEAIIAAYELHLDGLISKKEMEEQESWARAVYTRRMERLKKEK